MKNKSNFQNPQIKLIYQEIDVIRHENSAGADGCPRSRVCLRSTVNTPLGPPSTPAEILSIRVRCGGTAAVLLFIDNYNTFAFCLVNIISSTKLTTNVAIYADKNKMLFAMY